MTENFHNPNPVLIDNQVKLHRYWNLRGIIDSLGNATVANMLGKQTSYITAVAGPNPSRGIGDEFAKNIETTFKLPVGALDAKPDRRITNEDPLIAEVARMMSMTNRLDKMLITSITRQICGHSAAVARATDTQEGRRLISGEALNEKEAAATGRDK